MSATVSIEMQSEPLEPSGIRISVTLHARKAFGLWWSKRIGVTTSDTAMVGAMVALGEQLTQQEDRT